ncbi:hypothetical protein TTHERM_000122448 (macronuclear) [Tetrahymena thermophila SB210]|uniref:Uncharacterized protein n=1 Tax=Tetrahymena thermophila (strain SB210) TaxID=312017 RepID=W7X8V8_TETTS|nr:hypothetical protein TTHERM_000122448 [Tetrahymena thermophila SB210]EWS75800.1 hypothetical protein TTHERM_000122448 [Tetrahymena thermophila SB210]|eukprot:XP_012651722.1 hypothetical protein TTHERM_000122448 [Tetrahymena thermophila SB210]
MTILCSSLFQTLLYSNQSKDLLFKQQLNKPLNELLPSKYFSFIFHLFPNVLKFLLVSFLAQAKLYPFLTWDIKFCYSTLSEDSINLQNDFRIFLMILDFFTSKQLLDYCESVYSLVGESKQ